MEVSKSIIYSTKKLDIHSHELILNEDYHSREDDLCYVCGLVLQSSSAVYRCIYFSSPEEEDDCAHFFLHKSCAHLPKKVKHPSHKHDLYLTSGSTSSCYICAVMLYYKCLNPRSRYVICVLCVIPLNKIKIYTAYHRHQLTLLTRLATFQCDACNKIDTDFSYMCYTCPFWIHLSCSNLPKLLDCENHRKHPLSLAYSLPEVYRKFPQSCRICTKKLNHSHWLYYCPNCRFFAHITCATLPLISSSDDDNSDEAEFDESNLVHLPAPFHESLLQQCIKKKTISWLKGAPAVTPPVYIKHWSHEQHQLVLRNKSGLSITEDEGLLICNGCTKPLSTSDDSDYVFYECSKCEYILHRYCALFPKEMQFRLEGNLVGIQPSVHDIWSCTCCGGFRNGTQMQNTWIILDSPRNINVKIDTECALLLAKIIKHEAHPHLLKEERYDSPTQCSACHKIIGEGDTDFICESRFCLFSLHRKCAIKPSRVTHRWDPHPLYLIFSPEEVTDHPHEFYCEFCSEEIDTNCWFYHCSVCDLSFHLEKCIDLFPYSRVKFGATNIKTQDHEHSLTFVLNKKCQPCQRCHKNTNGKPVLECTPCKFIQHAQPELCS